MMSVAALMSKDIYFPEERRVIVLPTPPSEAETSVTFINLVSEIERRKGSYEEPQFLAIAPEHGQRDLLWTIAIGCAATIIIVGLIIGYLIPGPITGAILPIGLAIWWLLYKLADRVGWLA
jgi:hypothetical protein